MEIINVKKFHTTIFTILILIVGISIMLSDKTYSKGDTTYKIEYIIAGETLWSIAEKESKNNEYYENKDIRYIIYDLKKINNLSTCELLEGQKIKIPKYNI